jgi:hypothetical protein
MRNSKLLELLMALEAEEYRWLLDFLRSPYFNKHDGVLALGEQLVKLLRSNAPLESYERSMLFAQLFPDDPFDPKAFNHLSSQLTKLTERFIAQRTFEAEEERFGLYHLRGCVERGANKARPGRRRISERGLESQAEQSPATLLSAFRIALEDHHWFVRSGQRKTDPYLQGAADALDAFYFAQKLRLSCSMVNARLAINSDFKVRFLEGVQPDSFQALLNGTLAELYAEAYALLETTNDEEKLQHYLQLARSRANTLSASEKGELFNHAINYCIRQVRAGHRIFIERLLELYRENLSAGYLFASDGSLSPWSYKNMVKLGLGLGQFDWVTEVVEGYSDRLPPSHRTDAYHFSSADIFYHRKDYDQAIDFLNRTEFTDIHYALGARVMLIKIYYETDVVEALLSLLFSFRMYLRRNRNLGNDTRIAYLNFVRFTEKIQSGRNPEKLRAKISDATALTDRSWLLGKLPPQKIKMSQSQ